MLVDPLERLKDLDISVSVTYHYEIFLVFLSVFLDLSMLNNVSFCHFSLLNLECTKKYWPCPILLSGASTYTYSAYYAINIHKWAKHSQILTDICQKITVFIHNP